MSFRSYCHSPSGLLSPTPLSLATTYPGTYRRPRVPFLPRKPWPSISSDLPRLPLCGAESSCWGRGGGRSPCAFYGSLQGLAWSTPTPPGNILAPVPFHLPAPPLGLEVLVLPTDKAE